MFQFESEPYVNTLRVFMSHKSEHALFFTHAPFLMHIEPIRIGCMNPETGSRELMASFMVSQLAIQYLDGLRSWSDFSHVTTMEFTGTIRKQVNSDTLYFRFIKRVTKATYYTEARLFAIDEDTLNSYYELVYYT